MLEIMPSHPRGAGETGEVAAISDWGWYPYVVQPVLTQFLDDHIFGPSDFVGCQNDHVGGVLGECWCEIELLRPWAIINKRTL